MKNNCMALVENKINYTLCRCRIKPTPMFWIVSTKQDKEIMSEYSKTSSLLWEFDARTTIGEHGNRMDDGKKEGEVF